MEPKKISQIMACSQTSKSTDYKICDLSNKDVEMWYKSIFYGMACNRIKDFKIHAENKETLNAIFSYFHGNKGTLDLNKGIYLFGDFGVGKTSLFSIFSIYLSSLFSFSKNGFGNKSIEEVIESYKNEKDERGNKRNSIENFVFSDNSGLPIQLCFHEIGKEINEKYYGTDVNQVVNTLMMRRYDIFQKHGTRTHATSNYSPNELKCFDRAVLDRFKEMFNFVEWKGDSLRI